MTTKLKIAVSALALTVSAGGAWAQATVAETGAFSAGVALLSPGETGFLYGAQLGVNGVGSGAVTVAESAAVHGFAGQAGSGATNLAAESTAGVLGTFTFDRGVETSGSLAGLGNVVAMGEAIGASGFSGSAFGNSATSGTAGGNSATSASEVEAQSGLAGSVTTRSNLSLGGQDRRFAASNATNVGHSDEVVSYSLLNSGAGVAIEIPALVFAGQNDATVQAYESFLGDANTAPAAGVAFGVSSQLENPINLAVGSAGGGAINLSVATGGFFSGGASVFGENEFGAVEEVTTPPTTP